jgi:hypothetical protein
MNFNSILVVTYGRSGSTLLQGILNSIDGCIIRGENYNFCYYLYKSWEALKKAKQIYSPTAQSPWFGSHLLNEQVFISNCKNLLYTFLVSNESTYSTINCYGFKEIRYTQESIGNDLNNYLSFLKKIFPNVAFIFNTRNHENVIKSGWWTELNKRDALKILNETENSFYVYLKENLKNTFHITYEDIISKSDKLEKMFDFIGVNYNEDKINEVLSKPHSFKT